LRGAGRTLLGRNRRILDTSLFCANTSSRIYAEVNNNEGELERFLIIDNEATEPIIVNKVEDGFETIIYYGSDNSIYLVFVTALGIIS